MVVPLSKNVEAWCWHYPKGEPNFPGLHFTAKPETCRLLLELTKELRSGEVPHRSIPLKSLLKADESRVTGGLKYASFFRLQITLRSPSEELKQMSIRFEGDRVLFDFTPTTLSLLEDGIRDVEQGTGDYSIAPKTGRKEICGPLDRASLCLWFWPCFGHLGVVP